MASWMVILIYISFACLGLPGSMLGAGWTTIAAEFGTDISFAGILTFITSGVTVLSGLQSPRLVKKIGAGKAATGSVFLIATAVFIYWFSPSFIWFVLGTVLLGLGSGMLDTTLNSFIALNFSASHMSWLHFFWGVGALSGPMIMAHFLKTDRWRPAYLVVAFIQLTVFVLLLININNWGTGDLPEKVGKELPKTAQPVVKKGSVLSIPGMKPALLSIMCYAIFSFSLNNWGATYFQLVRGIDKAKAAQIVSLYFVGLTAARFVTGFISRWIDNMTFIKIGGGIVVLGAAIFAFLPQVLFAQIGTLLVGIGSAPLFPGMIHEAPARFGKENAQRAISTQMAVNATTTTLFSPLMGVVGSRIGFFFLPFVMLIAGVLFNLAHRGANYQIGKNK